MSLTVNSTTLGSTTASPGVTIERVESLETRLPYRPGLDGLRAIAVAAVIVYHAEQSFLPGGFLGVEAFFVISGYLITLLLLTEWRREGRINLKAFWIRRARRLLPAVFVLLGASLAFAVLFLPGEVVGLRGDAAAAALYITNWYLILDHRSYFETIGRPSLLRHLWSLAVEEQFYLAWPVAIAATLGRWPRRLILACIVGGAALSVGWMSVLYQFLPGVDPSRLYFGTDTRASGLLVGAALAFVWSSRSKASASRRAGRWLDLLGLAGLAALIALFALLGEDSAFLYQGEFGLVALATAAVIAAVARPESWVGENALAWPPLVWVGQRSYSIYLWHWPVFVLTRPRLDVQLDGLPLLVLRITATIILAELSYRYVECPVRGGSLGRAWKRWQEASGYRRWWIGCRWFGLAAAIAVLVISVARAQQPAAPAYLAFGNPHAATGTAAAAPAEPSTDVTAASPAAIASPVAAFINDEPRPAQAASPAAGGAEPTPLPILASETPITGPLAAGAIAAAPTERVTAVGDSVMLGATDELSRQIEGIEVDASVSRQAAAAIEVLRARRDAGQLGSTVVLQVGNNGLLTARQLDEMMTLIGSRRVVIVNTRIPRTWEAPNNSLLADAVRRHSNAALADWYSASSGKTGLLWDDEIHLRPEGAHVFAGLVAAAIRRP